MYTEWVFLTLSVIKLLQMRSTSITTNIDRWECMKAGWAAKHELAHEGLNFVFVLW